MIARSTDRTSEDSTAIDRQDAKFSFRWNQAKRKSRRRDFARRSGVGRHDFTGINFAHVSLRVPDARRLMNADLRHADLSGQT
jgi:hypothetical protein